MSGKVFFSVSMSLDGFIAPESLGNRWGSSGWNSSSGSSRNGFFRENLGLGEGGEEGRDNDLLRGTFDRTGLAQVRAESSSRVTHLSYAVRQR